MARLFISYKREEQAYAFALRQWLIDAQDWPPQEVFVDRDKVHAGDTWAEKIFREAEASEAMLFLASELSLKPESFCYKELQRARGVTIAVTIRELDPKDERLKSALPHGADARQITALDGQPTAGFEYVSPIDGQHGVVALNRTQVESIGQTLRDLGIAPNSFTWKPSPDGPYRGLGALQEGDEALFFGREREVRDCIRRLEQVRQSVSDRALLIQAPSGAGKSSLLRAGLWRRLRRHAAFSPLAVVRIREGVLSNEEWGLASGLAKPEANLLNVPLGVLEDRVANDLPRLLADFAEADASRAGGRRTMLLGIDQAEELPTLTKPQELEELNRLFTGLAEASQAHDVRLVLTARDDSIDATLKELAAFGIGQEAVRMYRLNRMPPSRFKEVIEKPAQVAASAGFPLRMDDALVTALAEAAAQNQGEFSDALPILALALHRLVRKRRAPDGTISAEPENAGRLVSDAVADATKEALETAGADEAALRRLIVPRLVTWDPRAGEGGAAKRRVASASELFADDRTSLKTLAEGLVDQRLLTRSGDNYEVAHEALLRVAPLGSLILELRGKFLRADMLTMEARDWQEYGRRIEWVARTGERLGDAHALVADHDFGPMLSAPELGVRDYLAACVEKDRQEQELRERIERYELANLTAALETQKQLQGSTNQFQRKAQALRPGAVRGHGAKVYISYSRHDAIISDRISEVLQDHGFDVLIDRREIALGENWLQRMEELITGSHKVLFLVSPHSLSSETCRRDIENATRAGKTIIPVMVREVDLYNAPPSIAERNIVFMRTDEELERATPALLSALATDLEWVREQARISELAFAWKRGMDSGDQARSHIYLFRDDELKQAEEWLAAKPPSAPPPTELQLKFIDASRVAQRSSERRRWRRRLATAAVLTLATTAAIVEIIGFSLSNSGLLLRPFLPPTQNEQLGDFAKMSVRVKELEAALRRVDAGHPLLKPRD